MPTNTLTYRLLSLCFLVLMLGAPLAKGMAHSQAVAKHTLSKAQKSDQKQQDTDTPSSEETVFSIPTDIQAIVTTGIQLKAEWVMAPLQVVPTPILLKVDKEDIFSPTSSQYYRTVCTHFVAPQAP